MRTVIVTLLLVVLFVGHSQARRLKIYSYPKEITAGQMAAIIFENPTADQVIARTKCSAEKLLAWVKQDVPILRIEQNGKQIYTSLGSYKSVGDSCVASWMVPTTLIAGEATIYILNDRDASVPYKFTVNVQMQCKLVKILSGSVKPLEHFSVIGEGFVPAEILETKGWIHELESNLGYSNLSKADQFTALNKRMSVDWAGVATGNFLLIEQGAKQWNVFVEDCGIQKEGLMLDFICPPDLTPGEATLTMNIRYNRVETVKSPPLKVIVQ